MKIAESREERGTNKRKIEKNGIREKMEELTGNKEE